MRPRTPPYKRFRIRRFLLWMPFEVRIQQAWIAFLLQVGIGYSYMQNRSFCYAPVTKAGIAYPDGIRLVYATLDKVSHPCPDFLPRFPNTRTDAVSKPFIGFAKKSFHARKVIVPYPPSYKF